MCAEKSFWLATKIVFFTPWVVLYQVSLSLHVREAQGWLYWRAIPPTVVVPLVFVASSESPSEFVNPVITQVAVHTPFLAVPLVSIAATGTTAVLEMNVTFTLVTSDPLDATVTFVVRVHPLRKFPMNAGENQTFEIVGEPGAVDVPPLRPTELLVVGHVTVVGVGDGVGLGVGVAVGVLVGVDVGVLVTVEVGVGVLSGVEVTVGVAVALGDCVAVGLCVVAAVGELVGVDVLTVGVAVALGDAACVGDEVGLGEVPIIVCVPLAESALTKGRTAWYFMLFGAAELAVL